MPDYTLTEGDDTFQQPAANRDRWENVFGLGGNDTLSMYNGALFGGPGSDVLQAVVYQQETWRGVFVDYGADPSGVRVYLEAQSATDGWGDVDRLVNIRNVNGSPHSDLIIGNGEDNYFHPGLGNDTVIGGAGYDGLAFPGWSAGPGLPWYPTRLGDLNFEVSPDGRSALITHRGLASSSWSLYDVEFIDVEIRPGEGRRVQLTEFITLDSVARQAIAAGGDMRWNAGSALGTGVTLTFSFVEQAPASGPGSVGFRAFTENERALVRALLEQTQALANLQFVEVTEVSGAAGQLRFGVSQQTSSKGLSWLPGQAGAGDLAGDVWMDMESMSLLLPGQEGYAALLHEVGHALGLRHPRNMDPQDAWAIQTLPEMDVTAQTVMSQTPSVDGLFRRDWGTLDVAALRHLYGIRPSRTGDDTYVLTDGDGAWQALIADDGGVDWLDASSLSTGVSLNLDGTRQSSVGMAPSGMAGVGNLALAIGTSIENARGTDWDDVLLGDAAANHLQGGLGNDWIDGGAGFDTAVFSGSLADYEITSNFGKLFVAARDGVSGFDTLLNIEWLEFADQARSIDSVRIEGLAAQGQTLRAVLDVLEPDGVVVTGYQWKANDQAISGAVGDTLVLTQEHVSRVITVTVTYATDPLNPQSLTSERTGSVADVNDLPSGYVRIVGRAAEGETLSGEHWLSDADGGGTDASGNLFVGYQWRADGLDIPGASSSELVLGQYLVGRDITLAASYWDWQGRREEVSSSPTGRVLNLNQQPEGVITISGVPAVGQRLQGLPWLSDLDGMGMHSWQWYADGQALAGATTSSLQVTAAHAGKRLSVGVTYVDRQGATEEVMSRATQTVSMDSQAPRGDVTLSGVIRQGKTLTASHNIFDPDGMGVGSWVWYADDQPLAGVSGSSLALSQEHVGKFISAAWTFRDGRGNLHEIASLPTNAIRNLNDPPAGQVWIDGEARQGGTLSARHSIVDADGMGAVEYRWFADGAEVSGAASSQLVLTQSLVGKRIEAEARYVDAWGTPEAVRSAPSLAVENVNDLPAGTLSIWDSTRAWLQRDTLHVNDQLTDDADGLGTRTYTWWADTEQIGVGTSVQLGQSSVGKAITVLATYTDGLGQVESVRSLPTRLIGDSPDSVVGWVQIEGEATVGQTLSMDYSVTDVDGVGPLSFEWHGNGRIVANSQTLYLDSGYEWMSLRAIVRFTDLQGSEEWLQSDSSRPVAGVNASPAGQVWIDGAAEQGGTLRALANLQDADGLGSLSYRWQAGRVDIAGATGPELVLSQEQVGLPIRVTVSYVDGHGVREVVTSMATTPVANVNDLPTGSVLVSGQAQQGETLRGYHGLADADGLGVIQYQWLLDGQPITMARSDSLTLTEATVGGAIQLRLTYVDGQGAFEEVTSAATSPVGNFNEPMTGTVRLSGLPVVGTYAEASPQVSDADGVGALIFRWLVDGAVVQEGSDRRIFLAPEMAQQTLRVVVRQQDGHGTMEELSSDTYVVGVHAAVRAGTAAITGTPGVDFLQGLAGSEWLDGLAGYDLIDAQGGDDTLSGGDGADTLRGGDGLDLARYGARPGSSESFRWETSTVGWGMSSWIQTDEFGQPDVLSSIEGLWVAGGSSYDNITGSPGNDVIEGAAQNDGLRGGAGNDLLRGGDHNDDLRGGAGRDTLDGGADWDVASYDDEVPLAELGPLEGIRVDMGRGLVIDSWGDTDTMTGLEGVVGSWLDDVIDFSSAPNGWMRGMGGNDTLIGSSSWDHVDYWAPSWGPDAALQRGIEVDLSLGVAIDNWGGRDRLSGIEGVSGSWLADRIVGDFRNNGMSGQGGDDTLIGGAGYDTVNFPGEASNYRITLKRVSYNPELSWARVAHQTGQEGTDFLQGVEQLNFDSGVFTLLNPARTGAPAFGQSQSFLFDPVFYLLSYPQLNGNFNVNQAFQHYLNAGAAVGHRPNAWFDPIYYANRWDDLRPLGFSAATLFQHYNLYGVWEGRSAGPVFDGFDGARYLTDWPDVAAYVDSNLAAFLGSRSNGAIAHYVIYGADEGRTGFARSGELIPSEVVIEPAVIGAAM